MSERILTGIRPSGGLTVANYVGAVKSMVELQADPNNEVYAFVADLHGLTDQEPETIAEYREEVVKDYIALGVDPEKTKLFLQSDIEDEIASLSLRLDRYITVNELMRNPTLKDKVGEKGDRRGINVALARYPIMMAADILAQDTKIVPVGSDQLPHIEITRDIAGRVNSRFGSENFPLIMPAALTLDSLRILSLNGKGKMSKSNPQGALFLQDEPGEAAAKIKKAETAPEGEITPALQSHYDLTEGLIKTDEQRAEFAEIVTAHQNGEKVMGTFKKFLGLVVADFLSEFQANRAQIDDVVIRGHLHDGAIAARGNARDVLNRLKGAMGA